MNFQENRACPLYEFPKQECKSYRENTSVQCSLIFWKRYAHLKDKNYISADEHLVCFACAEFPNDP